MAELNKRSYRLLRFVVTTILMIAMIAAFLNVTYGLQDSQKKTNEFIGMTRMEYADLTITKTVKNANGSALSSKQETDQFIFTVTFSDGGEYKVKIGTTEQTIKNGGTIILKHGQSAVIRDIPIGTRYNIVESLNSNYAISSSNSQSNIGRNGSKAEFINTANNAAESITVKASKVWVTKDKCPDSVTVQLYRNNTAYGSPIILNAGNNWTYNWSGLNKNDVWTVDEVNIPAGYIKKITGNINTGFIITNTMQNSITPPPVTTIPPTTIPEQPTTPESTTKPPETTGRPGIPTRPASTTEPTIKSEPPAKPDSTTKLELSTKSEPATVPVLITEPTLHTEPDPPLYYPAPTISEKTTDPGDYLGDNDTPWDNRNDKDNPMPSAPPDDRFGDNRTPGGNRNDKDNPKTGDDEYDPRPWLIILAVSALILRYILFYRFSKNQ